MAKSASIEEITATLLEPVVEDSVPSEEVDDADDAIVEDLVITPEEDVAEPEDEDVDEDVVEDDNDDDDIPPEGKQDEEDGDDADDHTYLDITDEDLIEVKVDGEVVYRTVEDAKKALSGEGAIEKRLKEATELRKTATSDYERGMQELETRRMQIIQTVQALDEFLFQPQVPPPGEDLRLQDPNKYLAHMDAYKADQERINQGRSQLRQALKKQQEEYVEAENARRVRTEAMLMDAIPELRDPAKQKDIMTSIVQMGHEYGFNDQEIAQFFDARAFKMVHDLLTLKGNASRRVDTKKVKEKKRTPRRLRSGVAQKMAKARQSQKQAKAIHDRARESGKVDDIAAAILKPGRRRR